MKEKKEVVETVSKEAGEEISKSKQKRQERAEKLKKDKMQQRFFRIAWAFVAVVILGLIVGFISNSVIKKSREVVASDDFSSMLLDNGFIEGIKASDCVTVADYSDIKVPYSEIEYTDKEIEDSITASLDAHKELNTESGTIASGDKVNIDYVGTIDGEEFEGGTSGEGGSDLEIGSGQFIEGFEDQLIGKKVGDNVKVNVTFPEDYQTAELQGKPAVFDVTVNGIYVKPELTDDFICAYFGDDASTVQGYKDYLRKTNENNRLETYLARYIKENSTVKDYPSKYLKKLKSTQYYLDEESYKSMNQLYQQYMGQGFANVAEYKQMASMDEYFASLVDTCKEKEKAQLIYQAILEKEGLDTDAEKYLNSDDVDTTAEQFEEKVEEYGRGYTMLDVVEHDAMNVLKEHATIEK